MPSPSGLSGTRFTSMCSGARGIFGNPAFVVGSRHCKEFLFHRTGCEGPSQHLHQTAAGCGGRRPRTSEVASLQGCALLSRSRHDMPGSQSLGCADRLRFGRPIHYQVETSPAGADAATLSWTYLWPRSRPVRWSEGKSPSQPHQRGENGSSRGPPVFGPLPRHILRKREWSV